MKKLNLFIFITILLLSTQNIFAYDFYTKDIHKGFLYKENIKLHISNQYGNVHVIPVQQDSITLDITISVEHFEEDKANKLLDEINVNFSNFNNTAKSKTVISNLFKTGLKFRIDYIVKMPSSVLLDISNNFGNIILEKKINKETKINLNYGKLLINSITNQDSLSKHIIKLNYSSAEIENCDNVKLTSNYSRLKIKNSKQLIVASSFSKLELDSNEYLIANCNHDTYLINKTYSTNIIKGSKSNIFIDSLSNKADIKLADGNIKIVTQNNFSIININAENVKTEIYAGSTIPYSFQIESKNSIVNYPSNAQIISSEKDTNGIKKTIKGILGENNNIKSTINIKSNKGTVSIL